MKSFKLFVFVLTLSFITAACATKNSGDDGAGGVAGEDPQGVTGEDADPTRTEGLGSDGEFAGDPLEDPNSPLSDRVIFFTYDSAEVQPEYLPVIAAHAEYLAANGALSIILEGHADERGSREYNIALAEQRAKSIAEMMQLQGVDSSQMRVISYGEEKPSAYGHDDESWSQNRRVEIAY